MEDTQIVLERHDQQLKALEQEVSDLKAVQTEIRSMNETLVELATELKHTNEHLARHERKIDEIESQPKMRMQQIVTAIIAALAGGADFNDHRTTACMKKGGFEHGFSTVYPNRTSYFTGYVYHLEWVSREVRWQTSTFR